MNHLVNSKSSIWAQYFFRSCIHITVIWYLLPNCIINQKFQERSCPHLNYYLCTGKPNLQCSLYYFACFHKPYCSVNKQHLIKPIFAKLFLTVNGIHKFVIMPQPNLKRFSFSMLLLFCWNIWAIFVLQAFNLARLRSIVFFT